MSKKEAIFLASIILIGILYWYHPEYFEYRYWCPEKKVKVTTRPPKFFWDTKEDHHLEHVVDLQTGDMALVYFNEEKYFVWYIYNAKGEWEELPLGEIK